MLIPNGASTLLDMKELLLVLLLAQPAVATTIAYDGISLAADTQVSTGDAKCFNTKIFKVDGYFIACAGFISDRDKFLKWFKDRSHDYPKVDDTFSAIVVKGQKCWLYNDTSSPASQKGSYAIGSGRKAAMAAMKLGCDAKKAVETAAEVDLYTGGKIESYLMDDLIDEEDLP